MPWPRPSPFSAPPRRSTSTPTGSCSAPTQWHQADPRRTSPCTTSGADLASAHARDEPQGSHRKLRAPLRRGQAPREGMGKGQRQGENTMNVRAPHRRHWLAGAFVVLALIAAALPARAQTTTDASPAEPSSSAAQAPSQSKPSFEVYGFAMLDIGHDFKQIHPNWTDTMRVTKLPSFENQYGEDNNTFAGVRQSRLGVRSSTPTALGDLKTTFEFELFGTGVDEGQTTFRLRHAYGEVGQFGAGQTWSPFMDPDVFPNSVEYWGPTGMVFFRNVQFRWIPVQTSTHSVWVAA